MKTRIILISLLIITGLIAFSQRPNIELIFTAENNGTYVQLDSITVMNRTQGVDTVLYYPDTVLLALYYAGIPEMNITAAVFKVFRNYPNPVTDQTTITLFVPEMDNVRLTITDILGRLILKTDRMLDKGLHSFRFIPGGGNLYFFTAQWRGKSESIKILHQVFTENRESSLEYTGSESSFPQLKATEDSRGFSFSIGDTLLYIGYADGLESGMPDRPEESGTYTFRFATSIPCPGTPTVDYEGQVYNTIQVFSQCWLKENLNVGGMIPGTMEQLNNGTIEKYCYNNEPDSCTKYGGLYQWDEMMQYTTQQGARGICPPGWHLPTDEEWKVLEGSVDSQYGIGDPEWDLYGDYRGYDAGTNMKAASGWYDGGNGTDLFDFSAIPGGTRFYDGNFQDIETYGGWWPSTEYGAEFAWYRYLWYDSQGMGLNTVGYKKLGFSVRCLRDE
jgi:uncharacterized protein (TIGR02145 family)